MEVIEEKSVPHLRNRLELIERGGQVRRYHTVSTLSTETVASHSYLVAWCVALITGGKPSAELLMAALQHDIAESVTGDLPAPSKRELRIGVQFEEYEDQVLKDNSHINYACLISEEEKKHLKMADICAGMLFCIQERMMGNKLVVIPFNNYWKYSEELWKSQLSHGASESLLTTIAEKWEKANGR